MQYFKYVNFKIKLIFEGVEKTFKLKVKKLKYFTIKDYSDSLDVINEGTLKLDKSLNDTTQLILGNIYLSFLDQSNYDKSTALKVLNGIPLYLIELLTLGNYKKSYIQKWKDKRRNKKLKLESVTQILILNHLTKGIKNLTTLKMGVISYATALSGIYADNDMVKSNIKKIEASIYNDISDSLFFFSKKLKKLGHL